MAWSATYQGCVACACWIATAIARRLHRAVTRPGGRIVLRRAGRAEVLLGQTQLQLIRESELTGDVNQHYSVSTSRTTASRSHHISTA